MRARRSAAISGVNRTKPPSRAPMAPYAPYGGAHARRVIDERQRRHQRAVGPAERDLGGGARVRRRCRATCVRRPGKNGATRRIVRAASSAGFPFETARLPRRRRARRRRGRRVGARRAGRSQPRGGPSSTAAPRGENRSPSCDSRAGTKRSPSRAAQQPHAANVDRERPADRTGNALATDRRRSEDADGERAGRVRARALSPPLRPPKASRTDSSRSRSRRSSSQSSAGVASIMSAIDGGIAEQRRATEGNRARGLR